MWTGEGTDLGDLRFSSASDADKVTAGRKALPAADQDRSRLHHIDRSDVHDNSRQVPKTQRQIVCGEAVRRCLGVADERSTGG